MFVLICLFAFLTVVYHYYLLCSRIFSCIQLNALWPKMGSNLLTSILCSFQNLWLELGYISMQRLSLPKSEVCVPHEPATPCERWKKSLPSPLHKDSFQTLWRRHLYTYSWRRLLSNTASQNGVGLKWLAKVGLSEERGDKFLFSFKNTRLVTGVQFYAFANDSPARSDEIVWKPVLTRSIKVHIC